MPNFESWSILWGIWNLKRSQSGFSVWLATTLFLFALMKRFYKVISASFLVILAWDNNKWRLWRAGLPIDDPAWWDQIRTTQYYNEFGLSKKPKQMLAQILASNQCQYLKKRCMMLAINSTLSCSRTYRGMLITSTSFWSKWSQSMWYHYQFVNHRINLICEDYSILMRRHGYEKIFL